MPPSEVPNPTEFCMCGCGCKTSLAPESDRGKRRLRGYPMRFLPGHNAGRNGAGRQQIAPPDPSVFTGVCGCGCGEPTRIAPFTNQARGWYAGYPLPFVRKHRLRVTSSGPNHPSWKGGVIIKNGYRTLYMPGSHLAAAKGYVLEHRLVWEQANGRRLRDDEVVHHQNGTRTDNRPENLEAMTRTEHAFLHNDHTAPGFVRH